MTGLPVVAHHLYYYFGKRWHPFITKIICYWYKWNAPLKLFLFEKRMIWNIIEAFFLGGGGRGGMHVPSLDFKSDCFVYWRGAGADPGFFNRERLIPIFIGHQTIHLFILSCPTFVPKHGNLGRAKAGWLHKAFVTQVFLYFGDYSHISICLSKYLCGMF